jgi:hypothetical protein
MSKYTRALINVSCMVFDLIPYILIGWVLIAAGVSPIATAVYLFVVFVLRSIATHLITEMFIPWATRKLAKVRDRND